MDLTKYNNIIFIGIGGIGMSALARYFKDHGKNVFGYDATRSLIAEGLEKDQFQIIYQDEIKAVPQEFLNNEKALVVYTPAMPAKNKLLAYFRENEFDVVKRSDALQEITKGHYTIAVGGAHGKTSTSALISHILNTANVSFTALIGGIALNFNSNYIKKGKGSILVVEADEYDRSFLKLNPDIGIITSTDADHLDIYKSDEEIKAAYKQFADNINKDGLLIYRHDNLNFTISSDIQSLSFDLENENADINLSEVKVENGKYHSTCKTNDYKLELIHGTPGEHFALNIAAAIGASKPLVRSNKLIEEAIESFKGVRRRFEKVYDSSENELFIYDDYAHHPNEIKYTIQTIRKLHPQLKLTSIFQPHLYSRTRDFADGFARELSLSDQVYLLPVYPAREEPIEGVSSKLIEQLMHDKSCRVIEKYEIPQIVQSIKKGALVFLGAGDIDREVQKIKSQVPYEV